MSTVTDKIARYEAQIAEIRAGGGLYADASDKEKRDAMLVYQTALNILLPEQGKFLMIIILCGIIDTFVVDLCLTYCVCVLFVAAEAANTTEKVK